MASFPGGSAWAMVREIAAGHFLVTERTFQPFTAAQLGQIVFELDRHLREVRAEQPALDDLKATQDRHRRISRLNTAGVIVRGYQKRRG